MRRYKEQILKSTRKWRSKGLTFPEIRKKLRKRIPKGTLSSWCRGVQLPSFYTGKLRRLNLRTLALGRRKASVVHRRHRRLYLKDVYDHNRYLLKTLRKEDVSKLFLAALYLGEGAKKNKGFLTFANSDPGIVAVFLKLLRRVYPINESRFRCTILCRADQNPSYLNAFWSRITRVPLRQFYEARIDARTQGKITKNVDYKGVCRIDLFTSTVYDELIIIGDLAIQGP